MGELLSAENCTYPCQIYLHWDFLGFGFSLLVLEESEQG